MESLISKKNRAGILTAIAVFIVGVLLQLLLNPILSFPKSPFNSLVGLGFITVIVSLYAFFRSTKTIIQLSQVPFSLSAIILFSILVLLVGLTPEKFEIATYTFKGATQITHTWPFVLSAIYLLLVLGLVILRRSEKINWKNMGFILNHLGIWLIVYSAIAGSPDLKRIQIKVTKDEATNTGMSLNGKLLQIPMTIRLVDFSIEPYPAKIAIVNYKTISSSTRQESWLSEPGKVIKTDRYTLSILQYLPYATIADSTCVPTTASDTLAVTATQVEILDLKTGNNIRGWVTSGTPSIIPLDSLHCLVQFPPEAKQYQSVLLIKPKNKPAITAAIRVNKPFKMGSYFFYPVGYDESAGRFSQFSVIEVVYDLWLPVIYAGIIMVMTGALFMFWNGIKKREP